jgi:hypothetical protein
MYWSNRVTNDNTATIIAPTIKDLISIGESTSSKTLLLLSIDQTYLSGVLNFSQGFTTLFVQYFLTVCGSFDIFLYRFIIKKV